MDQFRKVTTNSVLKLNPNMLELGKNFETKVEEIQQLVKNWRHRFLTPLGRNVIAKTLLMPKIAHISLVLPCLDKTLIKKIENIVYNFIWKGSDKIARDDSKKLEKRGGLNMPDIHVSWQAYKLSWFKRLSNTKASWGKIFEMNLKTIYPNASINDVFTKFGTFHLLELSKKFPSSFWKECFSVFKMFVPEYTKKYTENILYCSVWNSHLFLRNNLPCKKINFRSLHGTITYPIEILKIDNDRPRLMNYEECREIYNNTVYEEYISLKLVVSQSLRKLGVQLSTVKIELPFQPTNLRIINLNIKGCSKWTKILKAKNNNIGTVIVKERNWETSLGHLQGVHFWDKCYVNVRNIYFDNSLKLLYYNIV